MPQAAIIIALLGLTLLTKGLADFIRVVAFYKFSRKTIAVVVGMVEKDWDSSDVYYPVLEFRLPKNKKIRFQGAVGSSPPAYKVGDKVAIRYVPQKPELAKINSLIGIWIEAVSYFLFGATLVGLSYALLKMPFGHIR